MIESILKKYNKIWSELKDKHSSDFDQFLKLVLVSMNTLHVHAHARTHIYKYIKSYSIMYAHNNYTFLHILSQ